MNTILIIILAAYAVVRAFDFLLDYLNYRHLKAFGHLIPEEFKGGIDAKQLKKTSDYTVDKMRFGLICTVFDEALILTFIFSGLLDAYSSRLDGFGLNFIVSGLAFFLPLIFVKTFLEIPFSLYSTFRIENKYGFNKMTLKLWLGDLAKSLIISAVVLSILISAAFAIITASPAFWWFWVWLLFFMFSIFLMYLSPYAIEPLFNKYTQIEDESLVSDISSLMQKAGIKISKVQKMDASKRTKHSNAYFTGIGHVKRIVLFDTLLQQMGKSEILAILAHEAGHWKRKHVMKLLFIVETGALISSYLAFLILNSDILPRIFHLSGDSLSAKIILLGFIASTVTYPIAPVFNLISRKFEWEADRFACDLTGENKGLVSALIKLSAENLSNLHPHRLYAKFHYSHPPVTERIRHLKGISEN
ncbi:MAG: M48 family metallopeptidase [Victivallales bacterium]